MSPIAIRMALVMTTVRAIHKVSITNGVNMDDVSELLEKLLLTIDKGE